MLRRLLGDKEWLLADGAMGTGLFALGLPPDAAPETWLIGRPEQVRAVHRGFVAAGSDILLTNTFGANRARLARCRLADRVVDLNRVAVAIAREAARDAGRPVVIAGAVGPTGLRLGEADENEIGAAFGEQMSALKAAGADVLWIETMYAAAECRIAVAAAMASDMDYVVTATFGADGHTVDGVAAEDLARDLTQLRQPPLAIGTNCGTGPDQVVEIVGRMARAAPEAIIVAKANRGLPREVEGRLIYDDLDIAAYAARARKVGARIVGGCCGTTANDIGAMQASRR